MQSKYIPIEPVWGYFSCW